MDVPSITVVTPFSPRDALDDPLPVSAKGGNDVYRGGSFCFFWFLSDRGTWLVGFFRVVGHHVTHKARKRSDELCVPFVPTGLLGWVGRVNIVISRSFGCGWSVQFNLAAVVDR
eukprot:scaffold421329_cov38-Attheya_sp.AAC.1